MPSALLDAGAASPAREALLARLVCPACRGMLVQPIRPDPKTGALCLDCDRAWPVVRGVLDLWVPEGQPPPRVRSYPMGGQDLDFHGFWEAVLEMPAYQQTDMEDEFYALLSWLDPEPGVPLALLGAGRGQVAAMLAKAVPDGLAVAMDESVEELGSARLTLARTEGGPTLLVRCDLDSPPLRPGAWRGVLEYGVLHGVADAASHLERLAAALPARGRLSGLALARSALPQVAQSQQVMASRSGHHFVPMEALGLALMKRGWGEFRHEQPSNWMARYRAARRA